MKHRLLFIFLLSTAAPCVQAQPYFPVVAKVEQKQRDDDRRQILETELASERQALLTVLAKPANERDGERQLAVHRHEENIKALQHELDGSTGPASAPKAEHVVVKAVAPATHTSYSTGAARFWDPYNRASDTTDFSTTPSRRESHE